MSTLKNIHFGTTVTVRHLYSHLRFLQDFLQCLPMHIGFLPNREEGKLSIKSPTCQHSPSPPDFCTLPPNKPDYEDILISLYIYIRYIMIYISVCLGSPAQLLNMCLAAGTTVYRKPANTCGRSLVHSNSGFWVEEKCRMSDIFWYLQVTFTD